MSEQKIVDLQKQLADVEEQIADLNQRIPPHSVKPVFIRQLDELEEKRDRIQEKLRQLQQ
ncbi:MAG: hypothetical protein R6U41_11495 [Desulfosalsimonas sp.]|uniref:hypothetical protein n=1 Tax=Desulfosalsimonas sp. TaxID=3073848 RepID=UPI003970CDCA